MEIGYVYSTYITSGQMVFKFPVYDSTKFFLGGNKNEKKIIDTFISRFHDCDNVCRMRRR